jgi:peroxiredoxin
VTAYVYDSEKFTNEGIQILGVSAETPEEAKKLRDRVTEDCKEDRPHLVLNPYPVRLVSDPAGDLIRKAGAALEENRRGFMAKPMTCVVNRQGQVKWIYTGDSFSDRPGPQALARIAVAVGEGKEPPAAVERKLEP